MAYNGISRFLDGSINGTDDPTRPMRPDAAPVTAATRPDAAPPAPVAPLANSGDGGMAPFPSATGIQMPSFAKTQDAATRAGAAGQAAAAKRARTGGGTFDPAAPNPTVYSPNPAESTVLNPLGRPMVGAQPPVVPASPAPAVASTPTAAPVSGLPATAAAVIPAAVAAAGSPATAQPTVQRPAVAIPGTPAAAIAPTRFAANATAAGGVRLADGSFAFSNIPGQAGNLSQSSIDALANRNVVPAASFTNPGAGVATSIATGGAVTPGVSPDNIVSRPDGITAAYERTLADQAQRASDAQSDALSVATRDPRSPLGIAARNADIEAQSRLDDAKRSGNRFAIAAAEQAMDPSRRDAQLSNLATLPLQASREAGTQFQRDVGEQMRGQAAAAERSADRLAMMPRPAQITLADGSLGLLGQDGTVRPALGADGKAVKLAQNKPQADDKRQQAMTDAISTQAGKLLLSMVQPGQAPTPQQVSQARRLAAQQNGHAIAVGPDGNFYANVNGTPVRL
jgi:hypothetical protein